MKDINFIIKDIIKPITKHYSPVLLILTRNWQNIMGSKYCEFCEVEKVSFQKNKKNDGIIYITAFNNIISFYIEHNKSFILEKINGIFGYYMISKIVIKQSPKIIKNNKKTIKVNLDDENKIKNSLSSLEESELKESLASLGYSLFSNDK